MYDGGIILGEAPGYRTTSVGFRTSFKDKNLYLEPLNTGDAKKCKHTLGDVTYVYSAKLN